MKKNKLITAALITAIATGSVTANVYAGRSYSLSQNASVSTTTKIGTGSSPSLAEGEAMTVDAAVARAIERSTTIKTYEDNIEITEDNLDDVRVDRLDATEWNEVNSYAISYKQLELQKEDYKDKIEVEKQSIRYNIENYFSTILYMQDYLAIYDEILDVAARSLEVTKKQYELGMISQNEYDQAVNEYNEQVTSKTTAENSISSAYTALNTLLDYNVAATYPVTLDDEETGESIVVYEPVDKTTLATAVALATSSSNITIKSLERNVEIAQYTVDTYSNLYSNDSEIEKTAALYTATSSLNNTKLSYEASVKTLYQNILENEDSYNDLNNQLTTLQNTMSIYEKQYELGQITELALDSYKLEEKQLVLSIQDTVNSHYFYMQQYENPNLL